MKRVTATYPPPLATAINTYTPLGIYVSDDKAICLFCVLLISFMKMFPYTNNKVFPLVKFSTVKIMRE